MALRTILIACTLVPAAFAAPTIDGHVINSVTGADIPNVAVNLIQSGDIAYSTTTDSHGHFRIDSPKPGAYTATYSASGFWRIPNILLDEDFERECGRCFLTERGGQPFEVSTGPVSVEVKLPPIGKISGKVLDNLKQPVPHASVQLHWGDNWFCKVPSCTGISRITKTNEKGEYSVPDLDVPGEWLVSATAPSSTKPPEPRDAQRLAWALTFYPAATDPQLAERIMVRVGSDLSNVDIYLAAVPVHRVRGIVLDAGNNPLPNAIVTLSKGFNSPGLIRNAQADGTFDFDTVAEGEWRISANVDQGGQKLWAAQCLHLKAHDMDNVDLRPAAPLTIQGKIIMEAPQGAPAPQPPRVIIAFNGAAAGLADKPASTFLTGTPGASGDFQVPNVYPGPYQILPDAPPPQYYLDSIQIGGRDATDPSVEILPGAQPLTISYKLGGGTVQGTVENCAGGTVRLLPHDKAMWRPGFISFAACDSNDRYSISAIRPGDYYALAIAGDSPTPWYATKWNDDALVTSAATITVRASENATADLHAIKP